MTLHHCSRGQSVSSQKWPREHWESTHSCTTAIHIPNLPQNCHPKHKLRRTMSDPAVSYSTSSLEVNPQKECRKIKNMPSIDDSIVLSIHSTSDSIEDIQEPAQGQSSASEDDPEKGWTAVCENVDDNSSFGGEGLVNYDDYYYEEEENKSQILPFRNCSLRLHGLLFLILIYAAGYLAYTFASPSSKKRCQRPPSIVPPVIP